MAFPLRFNPQDIHDYQHPKYRLGIFRLLAQVAIDAIRAGIAVGYHHIATAQIYGNVAEVSQAIAESAEHGAARDERFISPKLWIDNLGHDRCQCRCKMSGMP